MQTVLDSIGVSLWQMAAEPFNSPEPKEGLDQYDNGHFDNEMNGCKDSESSESEDDDDSVELHEESANENTRLAIACDDGCVRIYSISGEDKLTYIRSLPRVSGETANLSFLLAFGAYKRIDNNVTLVIICRAYIKCDLESRCR